MTVYTNHQNLSATERRVLNKLRKNRKIVTNHADKGTATAILRNENYIREAHQQLNNPKYYKKLDKAIAKNNNMQLFTDQGHINKKVRQV